MTAPPDPDQRTRTDRTIEDLLRALAPQVLGAIVRRFGHFADAEDAVQEALLAAATRWPADGLPIDPKAWLIQVAARRLTDRLRQDEARRKREDRVTIRDGIGPGEPVDEDDSLTLMFLCCHPALTPGAAIPLTLRAVGGLTTGEIATAFLVPETTMAQRISRAKQRIRAADDSFAPPAAEALAARLPLVLHVLYLIFNEGYASSTGADVVRTELSGEAIRLARAVHGSLPEEPEVTGLLALMLLTDARRPARTGDDGSLIPLEEQDRSRWDRALIDEGIALVEDALPRGRLGEYQLQAAIAAVHDEAPTADDTDWPQILTLYGLLERMTGNPMVALNRAIATAMVAGPEAGLVALDALDEPLAGHHRLDAARAHLLERAGDRGGAIEHYQRAAGRTTSIPEREYLRLRAARLGADAS